MPNLLGQFWVDAEPLMRSMGWIGGVEKLPDARDSGYPRSAIVTQDPAAGQRAPTDIVLRLQFAAD
jgi:serine/threonine-protein kinase